MPLPRTRYDKLHSITLHSPTSTISLVFRHSYVHTPLNKCLFLPSCFAAKSTNPVVIVAALGRCSQTGKRPNGKNGLSLPLTFG